MYNNKKYLSKEIRLMKPALVALACLSACSSLVPSTIAQLASTPPAQLDPAALEVAVLMPAGLRPQPQTAVLSLAGTRTDTGQAEKLDVILTERPATLAGVDVQPGETVFAYRVPDPDIAVIRAMQARFNAGNAAAPDTMQGSISVALGACTVGTGPAPDAAGAIYIRMAPDAPMMPLVRRSSIAGLVGAAAMASIGPCAQPQ
jgi:hypothetical protein